MSESAKKRRKIEAESTGPLSCVFGGFSAKKSDTLKYLKQNQTEIESLEVKNASPGDYKKIMALDFVKLKKLTLRGFHIKSNLPYTYNRLLDELAIIDCRIKDEDLSDYSDHSRSVILKSVRIDIHGKMYLSAYKVEHLYVYDTCLDFVETHSPPLKTLTVHDSFFRYVDDLSGLEELNVLDYGIELDIYDNLFKSVKRLTLRSLKKMTELINFSTKLEYFKVIDPICPLLKGPVEEFIGKCESFQTADMYFYPSPPADDDEKNILILNTDCVNHLMKFLPWDDCVALGSTHGSFWEAVKMQSLRRSEGSMVIDPKTKKKYSLEYLKMCGSFIRELSVKNVREAVFYRIMEYFPLLHTVKTESVPLKSTELIPKFSSTLLHIDFTYLRVNYRVDPEPKVFLEAFRKKLCNCNSSLPKEIAMNSCQTAFHRLTDEQKRDKKFVAKLTGSYRRLQLLCKVHKWYLVS